MPEFLTAPFGIATGDPAGDVLVRLVLALGLGALVTWVYRHTRQREDITPTFPATLLLLSVLIAMVTQVIGDNVARAFSLVGALSIVRFRTVVRDTQDTAFVIFAVVVGMAAGAGSLIVALGGLAVTTTAAFLMRTPAHTGETEPSPYALTLRVALGQPIDSVLAAGRPHLTGCRLLSIGTARQGLSVEATYETRLRHAGAAEELVKTLNRVEGVQSVELVRRSDLEEKIA
jgi:hypothetical protein